jgi:hypothetical protein
VTKAGLGLRAERADWWPGSWSDLGAVCRTGPSGRAPVAAQQSAESFVDDHLAVRRPGTSGTSVAFPRACDADLRQLRQAGPPQQVDAPRILQRTAALPSFRQHQERRSRGLLSKVGEGRSAAIRDRHPQPAARQLDEGPPEEMDHAAQRPPTCNAEPPMCRFASRCLRTPPRGRILWRERLAPRVGA